MKTRWVFTVVALVIFLAPAAQSQDSGNAIQQRLQAQYALTKTTLDGSRIASQGATLQLKLDNLAAVPVSALALVPNVYKDGKLSQNSFGKAMFQGKQGKTLAAGTQVWLTKIEIKNDGALLYLLTDQLEGERYKAILRLQWPKGTPPTPDQAADLLAQVLDVQSAAPPNAPAPSSLLASNASAGTRPTAAPLPPHTPLSPEAAAKMGMLKPGDLEKINNGAAQSDLVAIRADLDLLNDKAIMQYFIALNNCQDRNVEKSIANELDYPAVAEFYLSHAKEILTNVNPPATAAL